MNQRQTTIETSNIKSQANEVRKINDDYQQLMGKLNGIINTTQYHWQGHTYEVFRDQYEKVKPVLIKFGGMIETLSKTMEQTAVSYEESDENMARKIDGARHLGY